MRCGMGWLFHDKAGIAAPGSRRIGGPRQKMLLPCLSALDMECRKEALRRVPALQRVTGLAQAMRNIDDGERIGAFDAQTIAVCEPAQHFAGPQRREGTVRAAWIERHRGTFKSHGRRSFKPGVKKGRGRTPQKPLRSFAPC